MLTLDTKLDILGVALIIVALISILSFLSKEPGALTRAWLRFLYQTFGWGAFVVPVAIGAVGVWLIWRHFGDQLPPVDPLRIAGVGVLFIGLMTIMHASVAATQPVGPVWVNPALADPATPGYTPTLIWEEARACPVRPQELIDMGWIQQTGYLSSYDIARCGNGGGYIGAFLQVTLQNLIGGAAVFVIALAAMFGGVLMATRKTLKDVVEYGRRGVVWARERRAASPSAYKRTEDGRMVALEGEKEAGKKKETPPEQKPAEEKKEVAAPVPVAPPPAGRPSIVTGRGPGPSPAPEGAAAAERPAAPAAGTAVAAAGVVAASAVLKPEEEEKPAEAGPQGVQQPASVPARPEGGAPGPGPLGAPSGPAGASPVAPAAPSATVPPAGSPTAGGPPRPGGPTGTGVPGAPPRPGQPSAIPGSARPDQALPARPAPGRPGEAQPGVPSPGIPQPGAPTLPGRPAQPGIPGAGVSTRPPLASPGMRPSPDRDVEDEDDDDEDDGPDSPLGGSGGSSSQPRPGLPPARPGAPQRTGSPGSGAGRPGEPQASQPARPGQGRTFGPAPPSTLGGAPRPAPKPSMPPKPADDEDDKDDIVFDNVVVPDDMLEDDSQVDEAPDEGKDVSLSDSDDEKSADREASRSPMPSPGSPVANPGVGTVPSAGAPVRPLTAPAVPPVQAPRPVAAPSPGVAARPARVEDTLPRPAKPAWKLPEIDLLKPAVRKTISDEELRQRAAVIEQTLSSFGAPGRVVEVNHGPVITQFGVEPDYIDGRAGKRIKVKVGKISALADDLALSLAAPSIRIEAPVPGKGFVGIEVPNAEPSIVGLRDVMDTAEFRAMKSPLKLALGQDVSGQPIVADLTSMPHLLIAGTTGSGKSVCVNGIITAMLMNCVPDQLKMIMVDPKRVELTNYNGIPHLMAPVVTELERIVGVLKWVQREMDERYRKFAMAGARNITDYNGRIEKGRLEGERLPYIIVIVDELADLMMLAPDETERVITRLAQMARATGIHIILSTQRPSVDVVTGLIKANFPARIAFAVATGVDSRVILDMPGAEKLLGRGDMLFQAPDAPLPLRLQGTYVSDEEIEKIVAYWRAEGASMPKSEPVNLSATPAASSALRPAESPSLAAADGPRPLFEEGDEEGDDLFDEAVELVRDMGKASISLLQRHLRIGYTRAARLIDLMEEAGMIGPHEGGSKPREVLESDAEDAGIEDDEE